MNNYSIIRPYVFDFKNKNIFKDDFIFNVTSASRILYAEYINNIDEHLTVFVLDVEQENMPWSYNIKFYTTAQKINNYPFYGIYLTSFRRNVNGLSVSVHSFYDRVT